MGGAPWGASVLVGKVFERNRKMGGAPPMPPTHYGKPCTSWFLYVKRFSFLFRCILGSFLSDLNLIQNFDIVTDCNTTYIGDSIVDLSWWILQNEKRIFLLLLGFNDKS